MKYIDCAGTVVAADDDTKKMFEYCDTHTCEGIDCPYKSLCDVFKNLYGTIPYLFRAL